MTGENRTEPQVFSYSKEGSYFTIVTSASRTYTESKFGHVSRLRDANTFGVPERPDYSADCVETLVETIWQT